MKKKVSRHHVFVQDKTTANKIARLLRLTGYAEVKARGVRSKGKVGGWKWAICYIDHAWLASLVRACTRANPIDPCYDLHLALETIHFAFEGNDEAIDSMYRLGGTQKIMDAARNAQGLYPLYRHLDYTWSFDE